MQRFQILVWPDIPKHWKNIDRFPDSEAKTRAYKVLEGIDALPLAKSDGEVFGLRFTHEAQERFDIWREELEINLRLGKYSSCQESHFAKYRSLLPSLALIFQVVDSIDKQEEKIENIGLSSIEKALIWYGYLSFHIEKLYSLKETSEVESARALLEKIKLGDLKNGCSLRDIYYGKHWSKLSNRREVEKALEVLKDLGWLRVDSCSTGGRPSERVEFHPEIYRFF